MQLIFTRNGKIERIVNMDNIIQVMKIRTGEHELWFQCGMSSDGMVCGFTIKFEDEAAVDYILDQIHVGAMMGWPAAFIHVDNIPKEGD